MYLSSRSIYSTRLSCVFKWKCVPTVTVTILTFSLPLRPSLHRKSPFCNQETIWCNSNTEYINTGITDICFFFETNIQYHNISQSMSSSPWGENCIIHCLSMLGKQMSCEWYFIVIVVISDKSENESSPLSALLKNAKVTKQHSKDNAKKQHSSQCTIWSINKTRKHSFVFGYGEKN